MGAKETTDSKIHWLTPFSTQHQKGVTPPVNEAHVDHVTAKAKGGENSSANAQVLSREENLSKSDKHE